MEIKKSDFVKSAVFEADYPEPINNLEFAFVGRSNVGKSSLINSLTNRKKMARTSKTPGRTQLINYFIINDETYLVDLPGYGFAKVPKAVKQAWGNTMERYLASKRSKLVFVLLDIRRVPSGEDLEMLEWLDYYDVPYKIIFTKVDKMSNNEKFKQLKDIRKKIEFKNSDVLFYSALSHKGREELAEYLDEALEEYKNYTPPVIDQEDENIED
ncbi:MULTISPECIES: ribosome biogenesis GTP-binding protein YihA/YsxC [Psychrilyobacter]|uniref:Probable GTP-binding protein EngB n=1 Tax=Psychrilyobacter piezotolerans TaxID=2293438 RepID=A0ABX9KF33_9FUSO|nr:MULTISPECIES: ribosome biogenesis GTP-binding protein YihA/YsxC [Psychrilyobacter]MCS5421577.1 ribosome biogenesis GTP-binding protein YihA/YsxC [Psychrilyobacter sp. S5]NDI78577.1 YihA family ribosome biogenesis GTP-binding protein [Psychrilyobacter piezotolerans]RDE60281.1 YihA family ribosome biogenesis GTP-binding protein [Psychrilyobacter sp. S5]REI40389.1 YihA family ribosome biogenesis GTP-binding protein [Psychrilyobacter piezotolerans]